MKTGLIVAFNVILLCSASRLMAAVVDVDDNAVGEVADKWGDSQVPHQIDEDDEDVDGKNPGYRDDDNPPAPLQLAPEEREAQRLEALKDYIKSFAEYYNRKDLKESLKMQKRFTEQEISDALKAFYAAAR